jgi:hypothetical protein
MTVWHQLFSLPDPDACFVCRQGERIPGSHFRFCRGDVELCLCELCSKDYFELAKEPISETVARSRCDPRDLIPWRGLQ